MMYPEQTPQKGIDQLGCISDATSLGHDDNGQNQTNDPLKENEELFHSVFQSMTEGVAIHRLVFGPDGEAIDYEVLAVNPAFEKETGLAAAKVQLRGGSEAYQTSEPPYLNIYKEVARTGQSCSFETFFVPLQKHFRISVSSPKKDWFVTIFSNVTEQKEQESEIRRMNRLYAVLSQVNQAVVRISSRDQLFHQVCQIAVEFGNFKLALIGQPDPETGELICLASAGEARDYLSEAEIYVGDRPEGMGPIGTCFRAGKPCLANDFANDPLTIPWRKLAEKYDLKSSMALPIHNGGVIHAVLVVYADEKDFFQAKETKLMEEVAGDISFALDHLAQDTRRRLAEEALRENELRFRMVYEQSPVPYHSLDSNGLLIEVNEAWQRCVGYTGEEVIGRSFGEFLTPAHTKLFEERFLRFKAEGEIRGAEYHIIRKDGSILVVLVDGRIGKDEHGAFKQTHCVLHDVTERQRAEEALRESEERYRLLFNNSSDAIFFHELSADGALGTFLEVNEVACSTLGYSREELLRLSPENIDSPDIHDLVPEVIKRLMAERHILWEGAHVSKDGRRIPVEMSNTLFELGGSSMVLATARDITHRKLSETALQESEEKFRSLFTASQDATMLLDRNGIFDCNKASLVVFGCTAKEQIVGKDTGDFSPAIQPDGRNSRRAIEDRIEAAYATGSQFFEWIHRRFDGTPFPAEVLISRFQFNGQPVLQAVVRDISWRKAAEQQLRQLSRAVEQSPSAVVITDTKGNIEYVNPKFTSITGYSLAEVIGKRPSILKSGNTPPEIYKEIWQTITSGDEWRGELQNRKKNGELFWETASICPIIDDSGAISHFLAVKEDITERKLMNERFLRAQRMESIGSLAGGIAHDLNNILAPIMMAASMMHEDLPPETMSQFVSTIEEAAQRGADIVQQVLTYARGVEGRRTPFNPKSLFSQLGRIVQETFPKSIEVTIDRPEDVWMLVGDLTQLHQVLLNLCVNARDAMPAGGTLALSAENYNVDQKFAFTTPDAKPGRYVKLTVTDSGTGIPPELLGKIFDPFFTTKAPGKGTGLGLSTVLGIVKSHGGFVLVDSDTEKGSRFEVFIPAVPVAPIEADRTDRSAGPTGAGELILIVDDEPQIVKIVATLLTRNGYRVLTAPDGIEAITVYKENQSGITAVLTDLMMPRMDGISLIRALRKMTPELLIVAATGHGEQAQETDLKALGIENFLRKPFTPKHLLITIYDAIHSR